MDERFTNVLLGALEGVRSRTMTEEQAVRTLKPTIVLGLGGTGAEVTARIKQMVQEHYRALGTHMQMIQFMVLDTRPKDRQKNPLVRQVIQDSEYFCLGNIKLRDHVDEQLKINEDVRRWWDERYPCPPGSLDEGAKRTRQVGRFCLHKARTQVENKLNTTAVRVRELSEDFDTLVGHAINTIPTYVISSSCGGTGCGMLVDALFMAWYSILPTGATPDVRTIIFMPQVYEDVAKEGGLELILAHRANAYALFKELEYFRTNPLEINYRAMNAQERAGRETPPVTGWEVFQRAYLIDRQLGDLGFIPRGELYNLVSDALFQMVITPVGKSEDGEGVTNIDSILRSIHPTYRKPTCFSSLGISKAIYPAERLFLRSACRFIHDITSQGLLMADRATAQKATQDAERIHVTKLGRDYLNQIDDPAQDIRRKVSELLAQDPTYERVLEAKHKEREETLRLEKSTAENRILAGKKYIQEVYDTLSEDAFESIEDYIVSMANTCEYGVAFVKRILQKAQELLKNDLSGVSKQKTELEKEAASSENSLNKILKDIHDRVYKKRPVLGIPKRAVDEESRKFVDDLRRYTSYNFELEICRRKEDFLEQLVAETGTKSMDVDGVTRKIPIRCIINRAIGHLDGVTKELVGIREDADSIITRREDIQRYRTCQLYPNLSSPKGISYADRIYTDRISSLDFSDEVKTVLQNWQRREEESGNQTNRMFDLAINPEVRDAFLRLVSQRAIELFGRDISAPSVIDAAVQILGDRARVSSVVMKGLLTVVQPCWSYSATTAPPPGENSLPCTYSGSYVSAAEISSLLGEGEVGEEKSVNDWFVPSTDHHQITLFKGEHGAPLFAVEGMSTLKDAYNQCMERAKTSGKFPVHIEKEWSVSKQDLPDIYPSLETIISNLPPESVEYFALGLFTEDLLKSGNRKAKATLWQSSMRSEPMHGYIYSDGKDRYYVASGFDVVGTQLKPKDYEPLAGLGRASALLDYAKQTRYFTSAELFLEKLRNNMGKKELAAAIERYQGKLKKLFNGETNPEIQSVLEQEYSALDRFMRK